MCRVDGDCIPHGDLVLALAEEETELGIDREAVESAPLVGVAHVTHREIRLQIYRGENGFQSVRRGAEHFEPRRASTGEVEADIAPD